MLILCLCLGLPQSRSPTHSMSVGEPDQAHSYTVGGLEDQDMVEVEQVCKIWLNMTKYYLTYEQNYPLEYKNPATK